MWSPKQDNFANVILTGAITNTGSKNLDLHVGSSMNSKNTTNISGGKPNGRRYHKTNTSHVSEVDESPMNIKNPL
jgi:hypothetical protein